LSTHPLEN
jgi:hypothetical protein